MPTKHPAETFSDFFHTAPVPIHRVGPDGAILDASRRAEDRRAALEAGFQAHVVKPIEPMPLVALLARLVQAARPAISGTGSARS